MVRFTGIREDNVKRYLADFQEGKKSGALEAFVGSKGKGVSGSPGLYLRMMGTLERIQG